MRERFYEEFVFVGPGIISKAERTISASASPDTILDFIEQELKKEREEIISEVTNFIEKSEYPMALESWTSHDWLQYFISIIKNRV